MNKDWLAGALAEAEARDEGLSDDVRGVRNVLEGLARQCPEQTGREVLVSTLWLYGCGAPRRWRLRTAWRILRG